MSVMGDLKKMAAGSSEKSITAEEVSRLQAREPLVQEVIRGIGLYDSALGHPTYGRDLLIAVRKLAGWKL